jgi:hypothetical protein
MSTEEGTPHFDDDFHKYFEEATVTEEAAPADAAREESSTADPAHSEKSQQETPPGDQQDADQGGQSQEGQESDAPRESRESSEKGPAQGESEEELRKKAHGYQSMLGRLQAEQRARKAEREELARMRDEMARMRGHAPAPGANQGYQGQQPVQGQPQQQGQQQAHQQAQQAREPLPMAEISDDIKDEAENFTKDYPDLVPLLRYPGREGEKLRKLLAEYGPDVAALHGQNVMSQYRLAQTERQMGQRLSQAEMAAKQARQEALQQIEQDRKAKHYAEIATHHPEVQWMSDPQRRNNYAAFRRDLNEWVLDRPQREARHIEQVLASGSAPDIVTLLNEYKRDRQGRQAGKDNGQNRSNQERERMAQAAAAVPGRPGIPKAGHAPPQDDFQAAWQEAVRR